MKREHASLTSDGKPMAQWPTFPAGQDRRQPTAPILQIENLGVASGGMQVIDDLSLSVEHGQIVSLIGPNGAGKTTVLNCISGFVRPQHGSITYDGRDLVPLPSHARAGLGISRTFQNLQLFASMTVLDNLLVALHTRIRTGLLRDLLWIPAQAEERQAVRHARTILDRLALRESERVPAGTLSFGQQKLLGVARCLALGGRLLLLDEPAAGLNRQEARALADSPSGTPAAMGPAPAGASYSVPCAKPAGASTAGWTRRTNWRSAAPVHSKR